MASNFPNPEEINENTGALWESGDTWTDSESGYTYIYSPANGQSRWRMQSGTYTTPNLQSVTDAGNNTTNDITIGPDGGTPVTTLGDDGNAYFASNVGIGTTSLPSNIKLEIQAPGSTGINIRNTNNAAGDVRRIAFSQGSGNLTSSNTLADIFGSTEGVNPLTGRLSFRTNRGNDVVEAMRIDSSGNVGIGTTSPKANLQVGDYESTSGISIGGATDGYSYLYFADGSSGTELYRGYLQYYHVNDTLQFGTAGIERMRIDSSGTIKFSTDNSLSTRFPGNIYHLSHNHNDGNVTNIFEHSGSISPYGIYIQFSEASPDNNTQYFISCEDISAHRFYVWSDGDVVNHDNSYGAISDVKLKQDIVDAGSQWDDFKNLRVRKFKFKSDVEACGDKAKTLIGLVAQEAELVSPGLVKESPDMDSDNNYLGTTTKTVNYSVLYMKSVKALQEAMERIETLEVKVTALETLKTAADAAVDFAELKTAIATALADI